MAEKYVQYYEWQPMDLESDKYIEKFIWKETMMVCFWLFLNPHNYALITNFSLDT